MQSHLEIRFEHLWESKFPHIDLLAEEKIIPNRRFRFDFVHFDSKVAIEINGGTWKLSKHSSGVGLNRDYEKLNLAQLEGWRVFQLSGDMINDEWLDAIANAIEEKTITIN